MKIKLKNITCCSKTELIVWKVRDVFWGIERRLVPKYDINNVNIYLEINIFPFFVCIDLDMYLDYKYYNIESRIINLFDLFHLKKIYCELINEKKLIWIKN